MLAKSNYECPFSTFLTARKNVKTINNGKKTVRYNKLSYLRQLQKPYRNLKLGIVDKVELQYSASQRNIFNVWRLSYFQDTVKKIGWLLKCIHAVICGLSRHTSFSGGSRVSQNKLLQLNFKFKITL